MLYECTVKTRREVERPSTLPPPCYHCKPPPFRCPSNGCLPPEPKLSERPDPSPACIILVQAALNISKRGNVIDGGSERRFFSYLKLISRSSQAAPNPPEEKRAGNRWKLKLFCNTRIYFCRYINHNRRVCHRLLYVSLVPVKLHQSRVCTASHCRNYCHHLPVFSSALIIRTLGSVAIIPPIGPVYRNAIPARFTSDVIPDKNGIRNHHLYNYLIIKYASLMNLSRADLPILQSSIIAPSSLINRSIYAVHEHKYKKNVTSLVS